MIGPHNSKSVIPKCLPLETIISPIKGQREFLETKVVHDRLKMFNVPYSSVPCLGEFFFFPPWRSKERAKVVPKSDGFGLISLGTWKSLF